VTKEVKEIKGSGNCKDYGINIGLGGHGKMNPVSGKIISEVNGKHGHLYFGYNDSNRYSKTVDKKKVFGKSVPFTGKKELAAGRKAILVNCEQSAPIDCQRSDKGTFGKLNSIGRGHAVFVRDQYGGGHGLGGHSRFAATGGDDFNYYDSKNKDWAPTNIGDYGPSRDHYYDGMFIDLTDERFLHVQVMRDDSWSDNMVGGPGEPPA
jgi:hypothetical protein